MLFINFELRRNFIIQTLGIRKSHFGEVNLMILALVRSDFLDLANFWMFLAFDRFLVLLSPLALRASAASVPTSLSPSPTVSPASRLTALVEPLADKNVNDVVI